MSTPKEIPINEVRVGDLIEVTRTAAYYAPTESVTYRGVVTKVETEGVSTESFQFYTAYDPTVTLIERPEPDEPTKIGTLVKMGNGRTAIRTPLDGTFRRGGNESLSPWLYFETYDQWSEQPVWLTWGEVLGRFGQGVVEIIEPGEVV